MKSLNLSAPAQPNNTITPKCGIAVHVAYGGLLRCWRLRAYTNEFTRVVPCAICFEESVSDAICQTYPVCCFVCRNNVTLFKPVHSFVVLNRSSSTASSACVLYSCCCSIHYFSQQEISWSAEIIHRLRHG